MPRVGFALTFSTQAPKTFTAPMVPPHVEAMVTRMCKDAMWSWFCVVSALQAIEFERKEVGEAPQLKRAEPLCACSQIKIWKVSRSRMHRESEVFSSLLLPYEAVYFLSHRDFNKLWHILHGNIPVIMMGDKDCKLIKELGRVGFLECVRTMRTGHYLIGDRTASVMHHFTSLKRWFQIRTKGRLSRHVSPAHYRVHRGRKGAYFNERVSLAVWYGESIRGRRGHNPGLRLSDGRRLFVGFGFPASNDSQKVHKGKTELLCFDECNYCSLHIAIAAEGQKVPEMSDDLSETLYPEDGVFPVGVFSTAEGELEEDVSAPPSPPTSELVVETRTEFARRMDRERGESKKINELRLATAAADEERRQAVLRAAQPLLERNAARSASSERRHLAARRERQRQATRVPTEQNKKRHVDSPRDSLQPQGATPARAPSRSADATRKNQTVRQHKDQKSPAASGAEPRGNEAKHRRRRNYSRSRSASGAKRRHRKDPKTEQHSPRDSHQARGIALERAISHSTEATRRGRAIRHHKAQSSLAALPDEPRCHKVRRPKRLSDSTSSSERAARSQRRGSPRPGRTTQPVLSVTWEYNAIKSSGNTLSYDNNMPWEKFDVMRSALIEEGFQHHQKYVFIGTPTGASGPYVIDFRNMYDSNIDGGPIQVRTDGDHEQAWRQRAVRRVRI